MSVLTGPDVLAEHRQHVNRAMSRLLSLLGAGTEVRSAGCQVYTEDGTAYLSCGGYGVFLLGHGHPVVTSAVTEQLHRHPLATRALAEPTVVTAARDLVHAAPGGLEYVFFTNSGAEAVELGLKVARANGRRRVVAMERGFHGKTTGALSVTGRDGYREPFAPLLPDVTFVPYGDLDALRAALAGTPPSAVLVEPVQGEGGVRIPPAGFLTGVRQLCDEYRALLIADEIQSGLGRLGTWWGCTPEQIQPDVLLVGKILSGGVIPVGAMVTRAELYEPFNRDPLLHSSTYGGNPLAAVAASTTLAVLRDEKLVERSAELGDQLLGELRILVDRHCPELVREVRGRGLLLGVEFVDESHAADLMSELLRRRVLSSYSLNSHPVLRLTPPAVLTASDIDWLLGAFEESVQAVGQHHTNRLRRNHA